MGKYKQLVKNTGIIALGRLSVQLLNFCLLPMYTSFLTTEEYGIADLILSYVSLLLPLATLQIEQALFRELTVSRNDQERRKQITTSIFVFLFIQLLFFLLVGVAMRGMNITQYWDIFVLILLANMISTTLLYYARGIGANRIYALASFWQMLGMIVSNVVLITFCGMGARGMLFASFIGYVITILYLLMTLKISKSFSWQHIEFKLILRSLKYSIPLIPNALSWWITSTSDKVIVQFFIGVAQSGILAVSHKFGNIYNLIFQMFLYSWQESATLHKKDPDTKKFYEDVINSVLCIMGAIGVGIILVVPIVFPYLINEKYKEALILMPLYVISVYGGVFSGLYSGIYVAFGDSKGIALTTIWAAVINVIVHLLFINVVGILAAPISTIVSNVFIAMYRYFDSRKHIKIKCKWNKILTIQICMYATLLVYVQKSIILYLMVALFDIFVCVLINYDLLRVIYVKIRSFVSEKTDRNR